MNLEETERIRYSRQISLSSCGERGQLNLKRSTVTVIGAGGLGCATLISLVSAGVGRVIIFDFDRISLSNLQRQPLYNHLDVGQLKVEVAQRELQSLNPHVEVIGFACPLLPPQQLDVKIKTLLAESDLLIDCCDRFDTRVLIARWAHHLQIPHCYGAVSDVEGQVALFTPQSACLGCLFPTFPSSGVIQSCAQSGVMGGAPQVIGSLQASLALEYLISQNNTVQNNTVQLTQIGFLPLSTYQLQIDPNPHCPLCHKENEEKQLKELEFKITQMSRDSSAWNQFEKTRGVIPISLQEVVLKLHQGWKPRIIDVRSASEVAQGTIPQAHSLSEQSLQQLEDFKRVITLPEDALTPQLREHILYSGELLIYCEHGPRAERAASLINILRQKWIPHLDSMGGVYEMIGGYHEWKLGLNTPVK